MKFIKSTLLSLITLFYFGTLSATTISSTTAGGEWSSTSTWNGGVIPGASDDVIINGTVYVYNHSCNNISISSSGNLQNRTNYSVTINVFGNLANSGVVTYIAGNLYVNLYGDITNSGSYKPYSTTFKGAGSHTLSQSGSAYFEGRYLTEDTTTSLVFGSFVEFRKAILDGYVHYNSVPYFAKIETNGNSSFFNECAIQDFRIESEDTINFDKSDLYLVHFYNHIKTDGDFSVYNNVYINGDWTNLGTVSNRSGNSVTLQFNKQLVNYGTITSNAGGGNLEIRTNGDIENHGVYNPKQTIIPNGKNLILSQSANSKFQGDFLLSDTGTSVTLTSNVTFGNSDIHGIFSSGKYSTFYTNGNKLSFDSCTLWLLAFEGDKDTIYGGDSYFRVLSILDDLVLDGIFSIGSKVYLKGNITNNGILQNYFNGRYELLIHSKMTNNGTVRNNPNGGVFEISLSTDLHNNGVYYPTITYIKEGRNSNLSQSANSKFQGDFLLSDTGTSLTLTSDVTFGNSAMQGSYSSGKYSTFHTNGYKLSFDSCTLLYLAFEGDNDTIYGGESYFQAISILDDYVLDGIFNIGNGVYFNGNITNNGILQNYAGWFYTLLVRSKLTNDGTVRNNPDGGTFHVSLSADLHNNGIYKPETTKIPTGINAHLSQSANSNFGGDFSPQDTNSNITLLSDVTFKQGNIQGYYNSGKRSTIYTNGNMLSFDSCDVSYLKFKGDNDTIDGNGSFFNLLDISDDHVFKGTIDIGSNVYVGGDIINEGVFQNKNGFYNSEIILQGHLVNKGEFRNNPNGYRLQVKLKNSMHNAGVFTPYALMLYGKKNHFLSQTEGSFYESQYTYLEEPEDSLTLASNLSFNKSELRGKTGQSYVFTSGYNLSIDSAWFVNLHLIGNDTLLFKEALAYDVIFHNSPVIDGVLGLHASAYGSSGVVFNDSFELLGSIFNRSGQNVTTKFNGTFLNNGVVGTDGGALTINTVSNIINNGTYNPTNTYLKGKNNRSISGSIPDAIKGKFYVSDTFTLVGENHLSHLEFQSAGLLTIDTNASLSVLDYHIWNNDNMINNLGRISVKKEVSSDNKFYRSLAYYKSTANLGNMLIESYCNQQHPSTENAINMWWRLKPDSLNKLQTLQKLELFYEDRYIGGADEDSLKVFFSPNAGVSWSEIEEDVKVTATSNKIEIQNAPAYGHYVLSSSGLGVISFKPLIERAEPKAFGNKGQVTLYGFGLGLSNDMKVYLKKSGSPDITADSVYLTDAIGESFIAIFNVELASIGNYTLVAEIDGYEDVVLTDYFTIEEAERPEPWVMLSGRDKYLTNRWQTFTINYGNRANMDARGVPLFLMINHIEGMEVVFPDFDIGVQKSFIDDGWTQWQDTIIDLYYTSDSFAGYEGKMMRLYPFYVPSIGAMSSESVRVRIKVPSSANLEMEVWVTDAMFEGLPSKQKAGVPPEVADCINGATRKYAWDKAIGLLPGYDCYKLGYKVLDETVGAIMKDPNEPPKKSTWFSWINTAWGWTWSVVECAGEAIPVAKGYKIAKELVDITFDTKGAYDQTQECWDKFRKKQKGKHKSKGVNSFDPNEITGPTGYGTEGYIEANANMVYTVFFENKDSATAAANQVVVYDTLDKTKFDFSTFSFGDITIGDSTYEIQSFAKEFRVIIDLAPRIETLVQVTGSLDTASGEIKVNYQSVDRSTLEEQEDVDLGFLPPNKNQPEGEGNFSYNVALKSTLAHDAYIENKALIFFDGNKPIATNVHSNRIDKQAPSSSVIALPAETTDSNFVVSWSGSDPGCGIQNYTVMVSVNDSDFVVWKSNTSLTSDTYFGRNKTRYAFYSIATDSLGLTEGINDEADASTYVKVNTGSIDDLMKQQIVIGTNAVSDLLTIKLNEPGEATIYDISGRLLMQSTLNAGINNLIISHLIPQTYVVVVNTKTTEVRRKIVVLPN